MPYNIIASAGTNRFAQDDFKGLSGAVGDGKGRVQYINGVGSDGNLIDGVTGNLKGQANRIYSTAEKTLEQDPENPMILVGHSRSGESTRIAAAELEKNYPDANIKVVLLDPVSGITTGLQAEGYPSPSKYPTTVLWSKQENSPLYTKSNIKDSPNIKQITLDIGHNDALPGNKKGNKEAQQQLYDIINNDIKGDNKMPDQMNSNIQLDPKLVEMANQQAMQQQPQGLDIDPALIEKANAMASGNGYQDANMIANYKAANPLDAFSLSVNNAFENFGRGVAKKFYQAVGGNEDKIANIDRLYQAAQQQQKFTDENYPISSTIGSIAGNAALSAPAIAATGGAGLGLAGSVAQGAGVNAALSGLGNVQGSSAEAAGVGLLTGAAGGAIGSGMSGLLNKFANKSLVPKEALDPNKPKIVDAPLFVRKIFENTADMPFSGTTKTAKGIASKVQGDVTTILSNLSQGFKQEFGEDLQSVVEKVADPLKGNNFSAQKLLDNLASDKDWTAVVSDSGKMTHYYQQAAYNAVKNNVLKNADMSSIIPISNLYEVIDNAFASAINKNTGKPLADYSNAALSKLNSLKDDLGLLADEGGNIPFSSVDKLQTKLSNILESMYKANNVYGTADSSLVNGIKKSFDSIEENALKTNPKIYAQLRQIKGEKFKQLETMKSQLFARLVNDKGKPDEAAETLFNRSLVGKNTAQQFFNALDPVGRAAVKYGYAQKLFHGIVETLDNPSDLSNTITKLTSPEMKNMLSKNKDFIHTFFNPGEIQEINGALKTAAHLKVYGAAFSHAPTGRLIGGAAKIAFAASNPGPAAVAFAISSLFSRFMNAPAGPWLQAASKIKPDSPAYASLMEKIIKMTMQGSAQEASAPSPESAGATGKGDNVYTS